MRLLIDTGDKADYLREGLCLAAFLIMLDVVTGKEVTRRSLPELLDDASKWQSSVGHSYPQPNDPHVTAAIRLLDARLGNRIAPLQRFAYASPSTEQGWALKDEAWQDPRGVHSACRAIRDAIRADKQLGILDTGEGYPFLAHPGPDAQAGRSSDVDALMKAALSAGGRMRILLAPY